LAPGIFLGIQEGIIQTADVADLQHDLHPESAAQLCFSNKESDQPILQIYLSTYKPVFFDAEKAGQ
jgi:hypothetical protein